MWFALLVSFDIRSVSKMSRQVANTHILAYMEGLEPHLYFTLKAICS